MKPITEVWPGRPYPCGAHWDGAGVNFALFSEHGEAVDLCIFDAAGRRELQRIRVRERNGALRARIGDAEGEHIRDGIGADARFSKQLFGCEASGP